LVVGNMNNLLALGLSTFLAITTFGCAATTTAPLEVPQAGEAPVSAELATPSSRAMSRETAERAYVAMSERCRHGAAGESTLRYCEAASNLAANVLRDERRAEAVATGEAR
jgi:hypothetical protein